MAGAFTRNDLDNKIKELFNIDKITTLMDVQIGKYVLERRMSYLDIARALAYFIVVKGGDPKPEMGIGIVPYVLEDARYYFKQEAARIAKQQQDSEQFLKTKDSSYDIECKVLPKRDKVRRQLIDIGSISFEEDSNG